MEEVARVTSQIKEFIPHWSWELQATCNFNLYDSEEKNILLGLA